MQCLAAALQTVHLCVKQYLAAVEASHMADQKKSEFLLFCYFWQLIENRSEILSITACSYTTARPGNFWPPVPSGVNKLHHDFWSGTHLWSQRSGSFLYVFRRLLTPPQGQLF